MYISLMERKGIEKGLRKGMQKGRQEERTLMAVSMLREGIPLPTIAKITGFSEEEIQEFLRQQAN